MARPEKSETKPEKKSFYDQLADGLFERMQSNTAPWQKGFTGPRETPRNFITGDEYQGTNFLSLSMNGVSDAATFNQIADYAKKQLANGVPFDKCLRLNKGSKSHLVIKVLTFNDAPGKEPKRWSEAEQSEDQAAGGSSKHENARRREKEFKTHAKQEFSTGPKFKEYHVFSINECSNVPDELMRPLAEKRDIKGLQVANDIVEGMKATGLKFVEGGDQPLYDASRDEIRMPRRERYTSDARHAMDLLHECAHATLHKTRMNRPVFIEGQPFTHEMRIKEEMRAEITTYFTSCKVGCPPSDEHFESHASYSQSWLKDGDKKVFASAVKDAVKISEYLIERGKEAAIVRQTTQAEQAERAATQAQAKAPQRKVAGLSQ